MGFWLGGWMHLSFSNIDNWIFDLDLIPSCAEADSDLGFPNGGKSDSMLFFIWRT
jgi:hypothetical protein